MSNIYLVVVGPRHDRWYHCWNRYCSSKYGLCQNRWFGPSIWAIVSRKHIKKRKLIEYLVLRLQASWLTVCLALQKTLALVLSVSTKKVA